MQFDLDADDTIHRMTELAARHGDTYRFYSPARRAEMWVITNPDDVKRVLVSNHKNYTKGSLLDRVKILLGNGIMTSEGAVWRRQRRMMQPAFHRDRIAGYGQTMVAHADRMRGGWVDGRTLDIAGEMSRLTLSIVGKTLFDAEVESQAIEVGEALTGVMDTFWMMMLPFADVIERLPVPKLRRARMSRVRLDQIIYRMIADRRASGRDHGDLLSMLLRAQDEDDGGGMTDEQVRDEAMTIFLAGHETTANALTWLWYLVSGAPEVEARLHEEVDRVLQGRLPALADVPSLACIERIVTESMRLYPPAWIIGRRALVPYEIDGYLAPARSIFVFSPYIVQRDARWYSEPQRFAPERWTAEFKAALPPFAYMPFGGGQRRCIGDQFAWTELSLVLATIAQRWKLRLVPGHPVAPQAVVTLRLKHGLKMTVHKRNSGTRLAAP
jgi:cytochrome P450